jgi:hypothetical protein
MFAPTEIELATMVRRSPPTTFHDVERDAVLLINSLRLAAAGCKKRGRRIRCHGLDPDV